MLQTSEYIADWPDYPCPNFIALLEDIEQKWGEKTAIHFRSGKQKDFARLSFTAFAAECRRIARGLIAGGLKKGDRVALWAENRPEWMIVWMGAVIAGCVIVPVDYLVSDAECRNIISITGAGAFFYSKRKEDFARTLEIRPELQICIDEGEKYGNFGLSPAGINLPPVDAIAGQDPVSIVFTSGTTGFAKGVTLSHRGLIANVNAAILSIQPRKTDTFINVLPLHHTYPTTCSFIAPLVAGTGLIIVEKLVGKVVIDDIRDAGGVLLIAVPLLYDKVMDGLAAGIQKLAPPVRGLINLLRRIALAKAKKNNVRFGQVMLRFVRKKAGLGSIRLMVAGGGPLSPKTADFFESLGFNIFHGYGMSENSPLISVGTPGFKNNVSVGLPVKYTEVRIEDPDEYGVGEIVIKSPSIMLGYYKNPEATKEVITEDGWLRTGDLGYRDDRGYIYISGRKKNLIVSSGGKNIYPEEIEQCFNNSPIIGEILVVGRKDSSGGEHIFAVVVPNRETLSKEYPDKISGEGRVTDEGDSLIRSLVKREIEGVNRTLPGYKKIVNFTIRYEEFEKNAQKKIRRFLYKTYETAADPPRG
ncbi:MAG: AMP-binding protein [Spirochaetaceae bacterium]|jgi:long-chain acyl-CoA synthetase|nr:AMP-binding protein [Spirochaetaceae bacterium]